MVASSSMSLWSEYCSIVPLPLGLPLGMAYLSMKQLPAAKTKYGVFVLSFLSSDSFSNFVVLH